MLLAWRMGDNKSAEDLIKELISSNKELLSSNKNLAYSVDTLKKDVMALKTRDKQEKPHDDEGKDDDSHDGNEQDHRNRDIEAAASENKLPEGKPFTLRRRRSAQGCKKSQDGQICMVNLTQSGQCVQSFCQWRRQAC